MKNKINNCNDLLRNIHSSNRRFIEKVKNKGGLNLHFRALTAQILWLTLFYNVSILLIPVKGFLSSNSIFIILIALFELLKGIIFSKIPNWIDDSIKGNFFYNFNISFLNKWIVGLLILNSGLFLFHFQFQRPTLNNNIKYE